MKFNYQLTEDDILTHQLFILSESKSFQKRRAKGRMFLLLIYMITGMFIWQKSGPVTAALFYVVCLPLYFLYRSMEAKQYQKHIAGFVTEKYKDNLQHELTLEWDEVNLTSSGGQTKHVSPWVELESIVETSTLLILTFRNSNAIIIPKRNMKDIMELKSFLQTKSNGLGIPYEEKLQWKWK